MSRYFILILLCCSALSAAAQKQSPTITLRSGAIAIQPLSDASLDSFNKNTVRLKGKVFGILQFQTLPTDDTRKNLAASGIQLLEYLSQNAYTFSAAGNIGLTTLRAAGIRAVLQPRPEHKMDKLLLTQQVPRWAVKANGTVDVLIAVTKTFLLPDVLLLLRDQNFDVIATDLSSYGVLKLRLAPARLRELAAYPFVSYLQAAPPKDKPLNSGSRSGSRATVLNATVANGGKGLNGEGVVIGIGDNADVQFHPDFTGRLINRSFAPFEYHGTHTTGTMAGAGIRNELHRGYASKATIVSQFFSGILLQSPTYVQDYGMVLTNNSYGNIDECSYHGTYDLYAHLLDQQAFDYPELQHVFAAGNSGANLCSPNGTGYRTVLGGYQSAKNVISVGATNDAGLITTFSSRGPVKDGRTKPEIMAKGDVVVSSRNTNSLTGNGYTTGNGTSMAAPAVTGGLALLYQRYRQLHNGTNPKSALMKAVLCNGATDAGNTGPDFLYGYGSMNLLRSVTALDSGWHFTGISTHNNTNTHSITVPANTAQLKVMLYWHDPAASPLSSQTLVNDLDLELIDPATNTILPFRLDTTGTNAALAATTGADHINNMEQVVIVAPPAGSYQVRVKGTAVAQGPQEYFVAYDPVAVSISLTYPTKGTGLVPGESVRLQWDAFGDAASSFSLEYSLDDGNNWITISNVVPAGSTSYVWSVPAVATDKAKVRVTKNAMAASSVSGAFTILGLPTVALASTTNQCEGYIRISWNPVASATDYEVLMLRGDEMTTINTTTALTYTFSGLSKDSTYWVTVRPRINGAGGRRGVAVGRIPNTGSCSGTISDNDLKLVAIAGPYSGRKNTSTQLSATSTVKIEIKNLDNATITGFTAKYSINGGAYVTEASGATIAAGATYTYTFATPANLSAIEDYTLQAVIVNNTMDPVSANDTVTRMLRHLDNPALSLTTPLIDGFEATTNINYTTDTLGITGADRFDFSRSSVDGRVRPFVNTGFAHTGTKALTLDMGRYLAAGNTNYMYATYNLSSYSAATTDLRLDFYYNDHGQVTNTANKVWIRGSDTDVWIEAYDLNTHKDIGEYEQTSSIELSRLLAQNGQNFSSSFGVRWGQYGQYPTTLATVGAGYTFDNIRLYEATSDLQLISIDEPISSSCALTAATPIKMTIRNSFSGMINAIPVRYRINGAGAWFTDTIASVNGYTSYQHTFSTLANLSSLGTYLIEAIVDHPTDNVRNNDTIRLTILNSPTIASFPHLQDFESSDGNWYSSGKDNSWAYGAPASPNISTAASGTKAWKTRLVGNYNDEELSYLYSPCYNISALTAPTLSFSLALDLEDCGASLCDAAWVEYSVDGVNWSKLGEDSTNWYNNTNAKVWSTQSYTRWHVATSALPVGASGLRLRFVLNSDAGVNREGIAIDNIHIYDNIKGIAPSVTMAAPIMQTVSGSGWTDFESDGALVASIRPNGESLGATAVQVFVDTSSSRWTNSQYYGARNLTIKPTNRTPTDSVQVRFYFTDREVELLIGASGCVGCVKPSSVYDIGVSKYTDIDTSFENGSVSDDQQGIWSFIPADSLTLVPFDKGYYVEFKVASFSEFWLNNGGLNGGTPLPATLKDFIVKKEGKGALAQWTTASEAEVDRFEIEVAKASGNGSNGFAKIGEVSSGGNSVTDQRYTYRDTAQSRNGLYYYRLKTVDRDGSFAYSPIRPLHFSHTALWSVHPNPSNGTFYLTYDLERNETADVRLYDGSGKLVKRLEAKGTGAPHKIAIDLGGGAYAAGIYLLQIGNGANTQSFRLYKR